MKHQHKNNKPICEVCGARRTHFASITTCDPICTRAKATGRSRGQQFYAELVAAVSRPWAEDAHPVSPFAYRPGNDYNSPGIA